MQRQQNTNFFGCCLLSPVAPFPVFSHWMSNCHLSNTSSVSTCVITMTTRCRLFCSSQSKKSKTKGERISETFQVNQKLTPVSSGITDQDCSKNNWHIVMKITRLMSAFRMLLKQQPNDKKNSGLNGIWTPACAIQCSTSWAITGSWSYSRVYDNPFSNSLIIVKKITTVEEVSINYVILMIIKFGELFHRISSRIITALRSYIKHLKECFIRFPNTSKFVKNTQLCRVFSTFSGNADETLFLVFDNYITWGWTWM